MNTTIEPLSMTLPTGEEIDIIGGIGDMNCLNTYWGHYFDKPIEDVVEEYRRTTDTKTKALIAAEILDQSEKFAEEVAMCDEELQSKISLGELTNQVYETIMKYADR